MVLDHFHLKQFADEGYVVVRSLLDGELDLQPVQDEYDEILDRLITKWHAEGRLRSTYAGLPFADRLMRSVVEAEERYDLDFDISLPQINITDATPMHHGPAVFNLLRSPRLLDAVERFIGPEIYSNPVQHARIKLPESILPEASRSGLSAQIALHQDLGVIIDEADKTDTLTVWFPVTEANQENGCLTVVAGSQLEGLVLHCLSRDPLTLNQSCIPPRLRSDNQIPVPMEPGDVLFMTRYTQHSGLPNRSNSIRWSFDLRYHEIGKPTGRPWFPGFVARSAADPETELHDADVWADSWRVARSKLAAGDDVEFNRWKESDPRCA